MNKNAETPLYLNYEAESLVFEIEGLVTKCKAMVEYLRDELGWVREWEESRPDRVDIKNSLFSFADIAHDYIIDAHKKIRVFGQHLHTNK